MKHTYLGICKGTHGVKYENRNVFYRDKRMVSPKKLRNNIRGVKFSIIQPIFLSLDSQPWTLKESAREVILKSVFKAAEPTLLETENEELPNKNRLVEKLNELPLPSILIRYLKFYRDPSFPKPQSTKKRRRVSSDFNSDSSSDDEDVHRARLHFRIVLR